MNETIAPASTTRQTSPRLLDLRRGILIATCTALSLLTAPAQSQTEPPVAADAVDASNGDCNQWGGSSYRNNTPSATNIPTEWEVGDSFTNLGEWKLEETKNIKWSVELGSTTYGNPVVAGGRVFIGTNNGAGYLKRYPADFDLGCLLSFRESDGEFLWQHSSEKLPSGPVHDWPLQGICCTPLVEADRLWFVSSRGEVVCLDSEGFYDGEDDGIIQRPWGYLCSLDATRGEFDKQAIEQAISSLNQGQLPSDLQAQFATAGMALPDDVSVQTEQPDRTWSLQARINDQDRKFRIEARPDQLVAQQQITPLDKREADEVWKFDMMQQLGVRQHNMASCSVTGFGNLLFVNTSNGVDESQVDLPAPQAPSFIALDKQTGRLVWSDNSPGEMILHGQWSSPAAGVLGGVPQVIFAGGDGWVYSFQADQGRDGKPELLWKFDANPKWTKWVPGGSGTRNNIIATPVIYNQRVYVAMGQDPEHGEGRGDYQGQLWCIDPTKRGDVSPQLAVQANDHSKLLPRNRMQAVDETKGEAAIDNPNSAVIWEFTHNDQNGDGELDFEELMHRSLGTVAIKDDLLFIADLSGLFHCLNARTGKPLWNYDMLAAAWGSPLIVDGHVYIGDEDGDLSVFKLAAEPQEPISEIFMGQGIYSSPIVANQVLYIGTMSRLFAIQESQ
jgi:outer membrane protein assembly factor BamB